MSPTLNAVENLVLGRGYHRAGRPDPLGAERRDVERRMDDLGYEFDVRRPVAELGAAERTGVAIARALVGLGDRTRARGRRADGLASARGGRRALRRPRTGPRAPASASSTSRTGSTRSSRSPTGSPCCGRRAGRHLNVADLDQDDLVRSDDRRGAAAAPHDRAARAGHRRHPRVSGLSGTVVDTWTSSSPRRDFRHRGLTGSGREEIRRCCSAPRRERRGRAGRWPGPGCLRAAPRAGLALVPADRRSDGAVLGMTLRENCTLTEPAAVLDALGYLSRSGRAHEARRMDPPARRRPPDPTRSSTCSPAATSRRSCWRSGSDATARAAARRAEPGGRRRREGRDPLTCPAGYPRWRLCRHRVVRRRRALRHLRSGSRDARRDASWPRSRARASLPKSSVVSSSAWWRGPGN